MRKVWKIGEGGALFTSEREAKRAAKGLSPEWGRAVGGPIRTVTKVNLFESAEEWATYGGRSAWSAQRAGR